MNTQLFSEENKVPRLLWARKVAGSAKYVQTKWNGIQLFVSLAGNKSVYEEFTLLIKISFQKST